MKLDPGPSNPAYATGENELPVQEALAMTLRPGDVFYDVGANIGFFSVISARLVGVTGTVVAFEPVASNADCIRRNVSINGLDNVVVVECAVAATPGLGELWLATYSGGAMLSSSGKPPDAQGRIEVKLTTIDEEIFEHNRPHPDVVKIDVEGAEIDVLEGMSRTLSIIRPTIIFEVDDQSGPEVEKKYADVTSFLLARAYKVRRLEDCYPLIRWKVAHGMANPL